MSFSFILPRRSLLLAALCLTGCSSAFKPAPGGLPDLVVERLGWMDEVARVKQAKSLPVTDARREAELLDAMAREGAQQGLPEHAVRAFFSGQIEAAKHYQREWLAQHAHEPVVPGQTLPDLATTVRPALDAIGKNMLASLASARRGNDPAGIVADVRAQLAKAGYAAAVRQAAVTGVEEGLK